MLVDEYEQFQHDRTDDVVVSQSGSEEPDAEPPADDCKDLTLNSTLSPGDRTSSSRRIQLLRPGFPAMAILIPAFRLRLVNASN